MKLNDIIRIYENSKKVAVSLGILCLSLIIFNCSGNKSLEAKNIPQDLFAIKLSLDNLHASERCRSNCRDMYDLEVYENAINRFDCYQNCINKYYSNKKESFKQKGVQL